MRSIRLLAATTVILMLATGCGDNGGVNPPAANFDQVCTELSCTFTDRSAAGEGAITEWSWDFGDPNSGTANTSDQQNPVHVFSAAGTYSVRLTVTNEGGETNSITKTVQVTGGTPTNQQPVASFTAPTGCTVGSACPFSGEASTDPDGTISTWSWNFGDGTPVENFPTATTNHTFGAEGVYQVQLTVTDNLGATHSVTVPVTIGAASSTQCTTISTSEVDCALSVTSQSTITLTLSEVDCELGGNLILIPPPGADMAQNVFGNVCDQPDQAPVTLTTEAGAPLVLPAGTTLHVRLRRGTGTPAPGSPAGTITGTFPTWTLNFDDGGNPGGAGEPDFGDVVVTVQANPA